jgi:Spy/CpxP family protein refolding chaperone
VKEGFESLGRIRLQGIALLVAAFVSGTITGAAGERVWSVRRRPEPPFPAVMARGGLVGPLERLDLTPEQRSAIEAIMERRRLETDSIFEAFLPRMRATADSLRSAIREVLTPEQRQEFDRWLPPEGFGPGMRPGFLRPGFPPPSAPSEGADRSEEPVPPH